MACDFRIPEGMTPQKRKTQIEEAMGRLQKALAAGTVTIKVGPTGALTFVGGDLARSGISDSCAYRKLLAAGSPELRRALARAEAMAGRKVDEKQVAAGTHSHDGGKTWDPGHKK